MLRLQGTDGVRKQVAPSALPGLESLTPQAVLLEKGVMTEKFMELYAHCWTRLLIQDGAAAPGEAMVIGWDPRDPEGLYTSAVVSGVAKGGLCPWVIDTAPTPLVALFSRFCRAAGSIVVTASHNPAVYNGIKVFTRHGLKLLPEDDVRLSSLVMETDYASQVAGAQLMHEPQSKAAEAARLYEDHLLHPANSWIEDPSILEKVTLVVDASNGALSALAGGILKKAGFGKVETLCGSLAGDVNEGCGVAELEGVGHVTPEMTAEGGRFHTNKAMSRLLALGASMRNEILDGKAHVWAAVFDGDGDRLYLAVYDPDSGGATILTGDDTTALQARTMASMSRKAMFVNTVESDLNVTIAAQAMGHDTHITAVGDKWILHKAMLALLEMAYPEDDALAEASRSAGGMEGFIRAKGAGLAWPEGFDFIGGEESGHSITTGYLHLPSGRSEPVFHGDGMKCLLNTAFAILHDPSAGLKAYKPGFKKTLYLYNVNKDLWKRGSQAWGAALGMISSWAGEEAPGLGHEEVARREEPDMLYVKISVNGLHKASVFIRNSGTEDKTGVSLRGPAEMAEELLSLGERLLRFLMGAIKDHEGRMGGCEALLLKAALSGNGVPASPVGGLDAGEYARLLNETAVKQGLITASRPGARLTARGEWLLNLLEGRK